MSAQLSRLQRAMQRSIVSAEFDTNTNSASDTEDAATRLGIYATAYRSRLHDALAHNYPMLQVALGAERFAGIAAEYLDAHPSTSVSVRSFGTHLSSWLQVQRPSERWVAEFAQFEWALAAAFDAPDQTAIGIADLAALDPERWPQLRFEFSAALQRLTLSTNAAELYAQVSRDGVCADSRNVERPSEWLIWRAQRTARFRSIDEVEATALDSLRRGSTFAQMCEELFERYESESVPMQAAALLKRWITDELIVKMDSSP